MRRTVLAILVVLLALAAGTVAGHDTRAASVLVLAADLERDLACRDAIALVRFFAGVLRH